jgi:putative protein-disulfide isomerase
MKKSILYISFALTLLSSTSSVWKKESVLKNVTTETMKVLYVYDPLCGWCYGFGPVVEKIEKDFKGSVEVEIISGGMVMGDRIMPVGNMAGYILNAIPRIEKTTGIQFGQPYIDLLKEGTYVTSSEKPSVALCVYKSFTNERSVEYGHAIQTSFYKYGKDLNNDSLYGDLAADFNIDRTEFLKRMQDSTYLKQAQEEFKRATNLGVTGYPTLLLKQEKGYVKLTEGYNGYESIEKLLRKNIPSAKE